MGRQRLQGLRNLMSFKNRGSNRSNRSNQRLETQPVNTKHTPTVVASAPPFAPRVNPGKPSGSTKTRMGRRPSGHSASNQRHRRGGGKSHPTYRQHQRAKAGRRDNVRRLRAVRR